jgi:GNAT superfamily N-acetyltransferase
MKNGAQAQRASCSRIYSNLSMSLNLPLPAAAQNHLRRLNTQRDLLAIADLVELCFYDTLDPEGRSYLRNMRESARSAQWMGWADSLADQAPIPPAGLVWEEDGRLIGNLSLIPITCQGRRCYLIANVAVHPEQRGRGIGRMLTAVALDYIRNRKAPAAWLQVRDDNRPPSHLSKTGLSQARHRTYRSSQEKRPSRSAAQADHRPAPPRALAAAAQWLERLCQSFPGTCRWIGGCCPAC